MKALVLDGSRAGEAAVEQVRDTLLEGLLQGGYEVDVRRMRDLDIRHCLGCFGCWVQTPGECLIDDPARGLAEAMVAADLAVFLTPVTFGGYSYDLKKGLDRIICIQYMLFGGRGWRRRAARHGTEGRLDARPYTPSDDVPNA